MRNPTIGAIGTGDFAAYFIAALRHGGSENRIILSPHSREKAAKLARDHGCEIAADDKSLVAEADWMLLAVRPAQLDAVAASVAFRPEQIVLSAVAGVPVERLRGALGSVGKIVRIMPSSYIEHMPDGLIPLFPDDAEVSRVLSEAGQVIAFETEEQFDLATVAACMSGWLYELADQLADWFVVNGVPADKARLLATGNIAGAMAQAAAAPDRSLAAISACIATEGTFTKLGLATLRNLGFADPWERAMGDVHAKMIGSLGTK
jgi:pyrroline-5-carboxylate reductase